MLTGNFWLLQILGAVMTIYGLYVLYLMLRRPEDLAVEENHVSWAHMYRMMFVAQIGFALAYLLVRLSAAGQPRGKACYLYAILSNPLLRRSIRMVRKTMKMLVVAL